MSAYIALLRRRLQRDPCPFHSKRIAFVDSYFSSYWVKDYNDVFKKGPRKLKIFDTSYEKMVNGGMPENNPTGMKWIQDVDHVYIVHNVDGNHWVALDVDLAKEKIDCYDSIVGHHTPESELKILNSCRPFTRMIPYLMNEVLPPALRKRSNKQFSFRRRSMSKVPQNVQVGDCGVYALKFIECLALGVSFDGLCDENIQALRVKMAAEMHDEVPNASMEQFT